jgi:hypothetical protein
MANMRRAQSVRNYGRQPLALAADDLGMLRESDEAIEDVLRRQLLDKDRENDKVCSLLGGICGGNELTWAYRSFNQQY